jgi:CelD/BcsL family acetyltransferase involved in cellulose biosynthesis
MYSSPQDCRSFYPLARALSTKTYQHRLLRLGLPDSQFFLTELCDYAERGAMRGYLLFHRGRPIAYGYCTAAGDCLRFVFTGYDPQFAACSPGIVLVHEMLRSICSEGRFAILDLGPGEAQYKRLFATGSMLCATLLFFRPTLGHLTKVAAHRSCIGASDLCAAAAERLAVKQQLKALLRRRIDASGVHSRAAVFVTYHTPGRFAM